MSDLARNSKEMTMDKVKIVEVENFDGVETHVIIDKGNGEFTSMTKTFYDEQIKAQEKK
jgi:hypothetical protein